MSQKILDIFKQLFYGLNSHFLGHPLRHFDLQCHCLSLPQQTGFSRRATPNFFGAPSRYFLSHR